jgi:hypothetical protein
MMRKLAWHSMSLIYGCNQNFRNVERIACRNPAPSVGQIKAIYLIREKRLIPNILQKSDLLSSMYDSWQSKLAASSGYILALGVAPGGVNAAFS